MRKLAIHAVSIAAGHVMLTVVLTVLALGAVMQGFDAAPEASPHRTSFLVTAADLLHFPMSRMAGRARSSIGQYAMLFANGLIWAVAILGIRSLVRRIRGDRSSAAVDASR